MLPAGDSGKKYFIGVRGNKTAAADLLRLKRTTLAAKMKALEARFPVLAA